MQNRNEYTAKCFLCVLFLIVVGYNNLSAQEEALSLENQVFRYDIINTGEMQYNFSDKHERNPKYVNLIELETSISTDKWWKEGSLDVSFWSVASSFERRLTDDLLTFSNIEEDNFWLICSVLGYRHNLGNFTLFGGIRNMNIDYFISPYSEFFTNSSAGIYPTISLNADVANYPLGSMGIHVEYKIKDFEIKNSFYNNLQDINDKLIFKFQFDPRKYGYTNITQAQYVNKEALYAVGATLFKQPDTSSTYSLYALIEQPVAKINNTKLGIIGQLGYAPKKENLCYGFQGIGIVVSDLFKSDGKDRIGLVANHANINGGNETAVELTYRYSLSSSLFIQPAFHYLHHKGINDVIGLLRANFTFGN